MDGVELEFQDEALEKIAELALEKDVGARGLRGIVEGIMMPLLYEIPSKDNVGKCIITPAFIEGTGEVIYQRPRKTPAEKPKKVQKIKEG